MSHHGSSVKKGNMRKHRFCSLVATVLSAILLAGCSPTSTGQTPGEASVRINSVDGVHGEALVQGYASGIEYNGWAVARVVVEPGYRISDTGELVEWLTRTAWSMNQEQPSRGTSIRIESDDRESFMVWNSSSGASRLEPFYQVVMRDDLPRPRVVISVWKSDLDRGIFGTWPGEVPVLPEGVVVRAGDE